MNQNAINIPKMQALILADQIYVDEETKKKVIAGTFSSLWSSQFPTQYQGMTKAYVSLTNCRGVTKLSLRWVDLKHDSVLMRSPTVSFESKDPLQTIDFIMDIPPFPMPYPGHFAFELYCNDQRLGALRVSVGLRTEGPLQGESQ